MKHLFLLHGALGAKAQLQALEHGLAAYYNVHSFDFQGHGGSSIDENYSIQLFSKQLAQAIEKIPTQERQEGVAVFGYSMGGYVAAYTALIKPELISRIITLGTKWIWNTQIATQEVAKLDPNKILKNVPGFAQQLAHLHQPQPWQTVVLQTAQLLTDLGSHPPMVMEDFSNILTPTLLIQGDRDTMVAIDETLAAYSLLRSGAFSVLPHTPHFLEKVKNDTLVQLIHQFVQ